MYPQIIVLASKIEDLIKEAKAMPSSRELALAITKLQEASMWCCERARVEDEAQKGITNNG